MAGGTEEYKPELKYAKQIEEVVAIKKALSEELNELQQSREQDSITKE